VSRFFCSPGKRENAPQECSRGDFAEPTRTASETIVSLERSPQRSPKLDSGSFGFERLFRKLRIAITLFRPFSGARGNKQSRQPRGRTREFKQTRSVFRFLEVRDNASSRVVPRVLVYRPLLQIAPPVERKVTERNQRDQATHDTNHAIPFARPTARQISFEFSSLLPGSTGFDRAAQTHAGETASACVNPLADVPGLGEGWERGGVGVEGFGGLVGCWSSIGVGFLGQRCLLGVGERGLGPRRRGL